jgi:predicted amidohydrolase
MLKPFDNYNLKLMSSISLLLIIMFCGIVTAQGQAINPSEWKFESQRKEIAPIWYVDSIITHKGKPTLALSGGGKEYSNGHWYTVMNVEPDEYFQFEANFIATNVEEPTRNILARIIWQDVSGKNVGYAEYPVTFPDKTGEGWNYMKQLYRVPDSARKAKIELIYRWDANGIVHFGGTSFQKTTSPKPRVVRVATIHHRPQNSKSSQENLVQFSELIIKAADQKADIVCLPEGITLVGTNQNYISASELVPGPTTKFLGSIARKYNLYIVAGILERNGDTVFNTAVLIDRNGNLAGKYRKVSLPQEEIDGGITPGDSFSVFDTDFGRIGLMICWDVTFPEPARILAQKGAEIIFLPIWGGDVNLAKARAIENQVYLVSATYDMITAVFDLEGEVMKEATKDDPVIVVEIDLNKQKLWPWIGDLKSRIFREIPPQKAIHY